MPSNSSMHFIESLTNVQRVRLIVNRHQIETFLLVNQWKRLIVECPRLDRVIIQLVGTGKFTREVLSIEQELRQLRPGMIFRIKSIWFHRMCVFLIYLSPFMHACNCPFAFRFFATHSSLSVLMRWVNRTAQWEKNQDLCLRSAFTTK